MLKLEKLRDQIAEKHLVVAEKRSDEPVQYWSGGDWQIQGLEKAYANVLEAIDKLLDD